MFMPVYAPAGVVSINASGASNVLEVNQELYSAIENIIGELGTDHTYLLVQGPVFEVVRVDQLTEPCSMTVTRGIDNTLANAIASGTAITPIIPAAAIQDMMDALPPYSVSVVGVSPIVVTETSPGTFEVSELLPTITSPGDTIDVLGTWPDIQLEAKRSALGCCD